MVEKEESKGVINNCDYKTLFGNISEQTQDHFSFVSFRFKELKKEDKFAVDIK